MSDKNKDIDEKVDGKVDEKVKEDPNISPNNAVDNTSKDASNNEVESEKEGKNDESESLLKPQLFTNESALRWIAMKYSEAQKIIYQHKHENRQIGNFSIENVDAPTFDSVLETLTAFQPFKVRLWFKDPDGKYKYSTRVLTEEPVFDVVKALVNSGSYIYRGLANILDPICPQIYGDRRDSRFKNFVGVQTEDFLRYLWDKGLDPGSKETYLAWLQYENHWFDVTKTEYLNFLSWYVASVSVETYTQSCDNCKNSWFAPCTKKNCDIKGEEMSCTVFDLVEKYNDYNYLKFHGSQPKYCYLP